MLKLGQEVLRKSELLATLEIIFREIEELDATRDATTLEVNEIWAGCFVWITNKPLLRLTYSSSTWVTLSFTQ